MADFEADIVIVGAGMGGAHLSRSLAEAGRDVLVLEAGGRKTRGEYLADFYANPVKGPQAPYPSQDFAPHPTDTDYSSFYDQAGGPEFVGAYLRIYGGTTWHWTGFADRLRPEDFQAATLYGRGTDWPIRYEDLQPYYQQAERRWGVAGDPNHVWGAPREADDPYPMPPIPASWMDKEIQSKALDGMDLTAGIFSHARNSVIYDNRPPCCGNNTCVPICPINAKYDGSVEMDKSVAAGTRVELQALVTRIELDADRRVSGLVIRRPDGSTQTVTARTFVLAAHAIETPRLLLNSRQEGAPNGVANGNDHVGRYLVSQWNIDVWGTVTDPVFPYRGPQQTSGITQYRDGDFRKDYAPFGTSFMNNGWSGNSDATKLSQTLIKQGLRGEALVSALNDQIARHVRLNSSAETLGVADNRITLSDQLDSAGVPKPRITFAVDAYSKAGLEVAEKVSREVLDRMGATDVQVNTPYLSNAIIGGTTRMGTDPAQSVVGPDLRSHEHDNLYILGTSTHVSCPVNAPTLTVSALGIRLAEHLNAAAHD
ncbi:GMC oxidoreductase [Mameliella sediminis]|uniref:GMC oxidoreductase n=1 Tax=Mameliella sediminis TaxID=2836866 RepID=UPI001C45130A|nr:GMC family oxidoreductase [Mameliella sediminis]MBV7397327.1 GMC family oxidoreductase [Mameliella sediminis]